jgi:Na+/H+-translocating membrane pyrophosphatase
MISALIVIGLIFAAMCVVCVIGAVNIVRVSRLRDRERLGRLSKSLLIVGVYAVVLGWFLFSPGHDWRPAQIITMVALGLNAAFWFSQAFWPERENPAGEGDTPQSLSK